MKLLAKILGIALAVAATFAACGAAATWLSVRRSSPPATHSVTSCGVSSLTRDTQRRQRGNITQVVVGGVPAACAGETLSSRSSTRGNASLGTATQSVPAGGGSMTSRARFGTVSAASLMSYPATQSWEPEDAAPRHPARGDARRLRRASRSPRRSTCVVAPVGGLADADEGDLHRSPARCRRHVRRSRTAPASFGAAARRCPVGPTTGSEWTFVRFDLSSCSIPTTGGADSATMSLRITTRAELEPNARRHTGLDAPGRARSTWNQAQALTYGRVATTIVHDRHHEQRHEVASPSPSTSTR